MTDERDQKPRRALAAGGALLLTGLLLVGTGPSDLGTAVTLVGLLAMILGIHTFGRLGPEGLELEREELR